MAISGWQPRGDLATFADDQGFDHLGVLIVALADSAAANDELQERRRRVARTLGIETPDGDASSRSDRPRREPMRCSRRTR